MGLKEFWEKISRDDGIRYGSDSMSVDISALENDKKVQEVSEKIQKIWDKNVPPGKTSLIRKTGETNK